MVHVYLTQEEKAKTESEAKKIGISVSSYIKVKLFSKNLAVILVFIIIGLVASEKIIAAEVGLLGLTLDVKESGIDVDNVNITVEIYGAVTGEDLVYNLPNAFNDNTNKINGQRYG